MDFLHVYDAEKIGFHHRLRGGHLCSDRYSRRRPVTAVRRYGAEVHLVTNERRQFVDCMAVGVFFQIYGARRYDLQLGDTLRVSELFDRVVRDLVTDRVQFDRRRPRQCHAVGAHFGRTQVQRHLVWFHDNGDFLRQSPESLRFT